MIKTYDDLVERVRSEGSKKQVIVVGAADLHTLEGINNAYSQGVIDATLVGDKGKILEIIAAEGFQLEGVDIIDEPDNVRAAKKSVELIREGKGDILMKGNLQTADLMREVVDKTTGLKRDGILSHVGLFQIPTYHKLLVITDGGMVIAPDLDQKKQIIENAVRVMTNLGIEKPKVAALCAVEVENPKMQATVDAARLKSWNEEGEIAGCVVEGPISFDLMFDKESAKTKGYESPVAGDADICLVPDMTAGNLMAKAISFAGGGMMAGIIAGVSVPIVLVSRGASSEEKYYSLVFAAAVAD